MMPIFPRQTRGVSPILHKPKITVVVPPKSTITMLKYIYIYIIEYYRSHYYIPIEWLVITSNPPILFPVWSCSRLPSCSRHSPLSFLSWPICSVTCEGLRLLRGQWFIIMFSFSNGHKLWILPNVGESITIYIYIAVDCLFHCIVRTNNVDCKTTTFVGESVNCVSISHFQTSPHGCAWRWGNSTKTVFRGNMIFQKNSWLGTSIWVPEIRTQMSQLILNQNDLNNPEHGCWFVGVPVSSSQWEFQDPKMEVLYHIRAYFLGIFPYTGLKHRPYIW